MLQEQCPSLHPGFDGQSSRTRNGADRLLSTNVELRRFLNAARYRFKLLAKGRFDLLWYRVQSLLKGYDLANISLPELGLSVERSISHGNSGGPDLARILRVIDVPANSRVVDFGSGKGGAILTLSEFPFVEIVGVELSPALMRIAELNIQRARVQRVTFIRLDAAQFTDLDRFTHIYLYHPFPCNVVAEVMVNIAESLERTDRALTFVYMNPVCHDTVLASGLFAGYREFRARDKCRVYLHNAPTRE
jgi:SAM-dependent methyltransferase